MCMNLFMSVLVWAVLAGKESHGKRYAANKSILVKRRRIDATLAVFGAQLCAYRYASTVAVLKRNLCLPGVCARAVVCARVRA